MIPHLPDAQGFSRYFSEKVNSPRLKWKQKQLQRDFQYYYRYIEISQCSQNFSVHDRADVLAVVMKGSHFYIEAMHSSGLMPETECH